MLHVCNAWRVSGLRGPAQRCAASFVLPSPPNTQVELLGHGAAPRLSNRERIELVSTLLERMGEEAAAGAQCCAGKAPKMCVHCTPQAAARQRRMPSC